MLLNTKKGLNPPVHSKFALAYTSRQQTLNSTHKPTVRYKP